MFSYVTFKDVNKNIPKILGKSKVLWKVIAKVRMVCFLSEAGFSLKKEWAKKMNEKQMLSWHTITKNMAGLNVRML